MGMLICPICKKEIMKISGNNYIDKKCTECNRLIVYNPDTKETKAIRMPQRNTSSGCRFY